MVARTHTWKSMLPARCNLRAAACGILSRRPPHRPLHANWSAQAAWCVVCLCAIAFMLIYTQHASEIAGNSVAILVEIHRKLKYVQLGASCGPRQSMNQSSQFTHSTFRAACGKVWTGLNKCCQMTSCRPRKSGSSLFSVKFVANDVRGHEVHFVIVLAFSILLYLF